MLDSPCIDMGMHSGGKRSLGYSGIDCAQSSLKSAISSGKLTGLGSNVLLRARYMVGLRRDSGDVEWYGCSNNT